MTRETKLTKAEQRLVDQHAVLRAYGWRASSVTSDGCFWWRKDEVPGLTVITGPTMYTAFLGPWPARNGAGHDWVKKLRKRLHAVEIVLGQKPNIADLYREAQQ